MRGTSSTLLTAAPLLPRLFPAQMASSLSNSAPPWSPTLLPVSPGFRPFGGEGAPGGALVVGAQPGDVLDVLSVPTVGGGVVLELGADRGIHSDEGGGSGVIAAPGSGGGGLTPAAIMCVGIVENAA